MFLSIGIIALIFIFLNYLNKTFLRLYLGGGGALVSKSCPILVTPQGMNWSPPGSSVHGISQAWILEWVAIFLLQGIFPTQELNPGLLHCRWILYWLSYQEAQSHQKGKVTYLRKAALVEISGRDTRVHLITALWYPLDFQL